MLGTKGKLLASTFSLKLVEKIYPEANMDSGVGLNHPWISYASIVMAEELSFPVLTCKYSVTITWVYGLQAQLLNFRRLSTQFPSSRLDSGYPIYKKLGLFQ
ncbi:hypothetical protein AKJ16_DCAP17128 [Drosera capensis]